MTVEERVLRALVEKRLTLAVAESLTGGLVGARLTRPPGSSDAFVGGVIAYTDGAKLSLLGVDRDALRREGAVSAVVAKQMAVGARERFGADVGVALTGFAGPDAPPGGLVGKVFVGIAHAGGVDAHELTVSGDRDGVREGAVDAALELLIATIGRP